MKAVNPSHALAVVVVDELVRCGMTDAVIAPGSRSAALAMALDDDRRVTVHVEVDERSAAFLALGFARIAGHPAAVVSTSGTAAANFHPAVVEADHARVPLVVLTADRPPELRLTGANQTVDQLKLYGAAPRFFADVGVAEDRPGAAGYWRSLVCRAWAEACGVGGPPGAAHLNLAFREPLVPLRDDGRTSSAGYDHPLDGRPGGAAWTATRRTPKAPTEAEVAELSEFIRGAERGLIVVGDAKVDADTVTAVAGVAGWPLVAETLSGARSGELAVSAYDALVAHRPFAAAHRPDAVLRIGRVSLSRPLLGLLDAGVPQVLVDPDGAWVDPARAVGRVVAADPNLVCAALVNWVPQRPASPWLRGWLEAERRARAAIDRLLDAREDPTEPRTARDVTAAVPDGGVLVVASSMPVRDIDRFARPRRGLRVVGNRGASGIDGFVSTAMGAAIAAGGAPTVALAGDLSLLHDQNGFLLADRPDVVFVVVNNDGGGIFSFLPQARFPASFERLFATPHGIDLARLAAVHGLVHTGVERAGEVADAVGAALDAGGVHLVEVRTDRGDNVTLHRRLDEEVARAVADLLPESG